MTMDGIMVGGMATGAKIIEDKMQGIFVWVWGRIKKCGLFIFGP